MKTVFVIGAGASNEVGLPLGSDLISQISNLFHAKDGYLLNYPLDNDILEHSFNILSEQNSDKINEYRKAAKQINTGLPLDISIDNFLDKHKNNEYIVTCGKLAIAYTILNAEKNSKLYPVDDKITVSGLKDNWFLPCYQKITERCMIENLPKRMEDISFIIFNYDRCFEHFMCNALIHNYMISKQEASSIVDAMNIFHPYGKIDIAPFGSINLDGSALLQFSKNIKTFTETIDMNNKMITAFNSASRVIYLGFDFHKQNMDLLLAKQETSIDYRAQHMATFYSRSEYDMNTIKLYYESVKRGAMFTLVDKKCYDFFQYFDKSLSFVE
jgi:hypothetical protein